MENKKFKYRLEKWSGYGSRHECPKCHDKKSFVYYVDEKGIPLDKSVGRCNHESSCGYHYKPADYYSDNCMEQEDRPKPEVTPQTRKSVYNSALDPTYIGTKVFVGSLGM